MYFYDNGGGILEDNEIFNHKYSGIQIRYFELIFFPQCKTNISRISNQSSELYSNNFVKKSMSDY